MRKYWLLIIALVLCATMAQAKDFDFNINYNWTVYSDKTLTTGSEVEAQFQWKNFYLFGSWAKSHMHFYGQDAGQPTIYGFGLGVNADVVKGLKVYGQAGYYFANMQMERADEIFYYKKVGWLNETAFTPAQKAYFIDNFQKYEYELGGGFGMRMGLVYSYQIYKGLHANFHAGYQFMNLDESWKAKHNQYVEGTANYLEWKGKRNFSGGVFGLGIEYKF